MEIGVVKWFNDATRYGFITSYKDDSLVFAETHDNSLTLTHDKEQ